MGPKSRSVAWMLTLAVLAGGAAPAVREVPRDLYAQLTSDDFAEREAAQQQLDQMPPSGVGELLVRAAGDAEIRARAENRLARVRTSFKFQFGGGTTAAGFTPVSAGLTYHDRIKGPWGFEPGAKIVEVPEEYRGYLMPAQYITSPQPFYFSVAVPEGNYRVTVGAGSPDGPTDLTVKAELRRLMLENLSLARGEYAKRSFVVNVRVPFYAGGKVSLKKPRETTDEAWAWDEKLTLEFTGVHQNLTYLEIEKVDVPTVYLLGDSTMCDQAKEPWNSWGQMFTRFFNDDVAIANHAESGETVASSLAAHRFDKIVSQLRKGDYVFFAFGHNDMKPGAVPLEVYKADYHTIIKQTKAKGATPVVLSSVERMTGVTANTLGDYPAAAKQVAEDEGVPFIDLHAMSQTMYQHLGDDLKAAFTFDAGKQDQTHHNGYGSYEISKLVLEGIRQNKLELANHIRPDVPAFDPAHPSRPNEYHVPASPTSAAAPPAGN